MTVLEQMSSAAPPSERRTERNPFPWWLFFYELRRASEGHVNELQNDLNEIKMPPRVREKEKIHLR